MGLVVEREIAEQMDKLVQERVAECLKTHIPQELQDEVARSKRELKQVRLELHDSCVGLIYKLQLIILNTTEFVRESRRANANLRRLTGSQDDDRPSPSLATIHMTDGTISRHYPKDLESLFKLDGKLNILKVVLTRFLIFYLKLKLLMHLCLIMNSLPRIPIPKTTTSTGLCNFVESNTNWWNEIIMFLHLFETDCIEYAQVRR